MQSKSLLTRRVSLRHRSYHGEPSIWNQLSRKPLSVNCLPLPRIVSISVVSQVITNTSPVLVLVLQLRWLHHNHWLNPTSMEWSVERKYRLFYRKHRKSMVRSVTTI
uniref:Uncharacterized protein n=1 Tax=Cacopsylla melanoneura TaxID=428564 RepID=A0A8D8LZR9_9HEMI